MRFRAAISLVLGVVMVLGAAPASAWPDRGPQLTQTDVDRGVLSRAEIDKAREQAAQQKRDAQAMVRGRAQKLGYSAQEIAKALDPAMLRSGKFRVTLTAPGLEGVVVEFDWYRTGFAENAISNTSKVPAALRAKSFETNKGGIRLHKHVFPDEVYALALKMDTKLGMSHDGLQGHAVRGAKGGIGPGRVVHVPKHVSLIKKGALVDPAASFVPRAAVMRGFGRAYLKQSAVGPGLDVQAGDVNTKAPEMKVLSHTYGSRRRPSAGVSGKELMHKRNGEIDPRGGIAYRATSTGDGVWMSARLAAKRVGLEVSGASVVAQGWGEVGRAFAESASKDGARVIAVQELFVVNGERKPGVVELPASLQHDKQALATFKDDIDAVIKGKLDIATYKNGALLKHFKEGGDAADIKADIVGLNAMGNVLTGKTVPRYVRSGTHSGKRKVLVEGANLAADSAGAHRLADRRYQRWLISVPGDLANVGGVHISNLEAAQNAYGEVVTSPTARKSLHKTITEGWQAAMEIAKRLGVSEREAIELAAVDAMMKRSLHRKDAPIASVDDAVISKLARSKNAGAIERWVSRSLAHARRTRVFTGGLEAIAHHLTRRALVLTRQRSKRSKKGSTHKRGRLRSWLGWGRGAKTAHATAPTKRARRFSPRRWIRRVLRRRH